MVTRLIAIVIAGVTLTSYAPRWLATGDQAWIIWAAAAAVVFGGPRLLRYAVAAVTGRVSAIGRRRPAVGAIHGEPVEPAHRRPVWRLVTRMLVVGQTAAMAATRRILIDRPTVNPRGPRQ